MEFPGFPTICWNYVHSEIIASDCDMLRENVNISCIDERREKLNILYDKIKSLFP